MSASILVTYATRYGSTEEVAKTIVGVFREHGLEVDFQPMRNVQSLAGYHVVIFGAPLFIGQWHMDAQNFLARHHEALMRRQVAVFTLGPVRQDEQEWEGVRTQLEQQLAKYPWLDPVSTELFGGKYDPDHLRFLDGLLARLPASPLHEMPASDVRDWTAIRAWATGLLKEFHLEATAAIER
jgi:menaquinone-dependent protoporphyrinogen oxidase